MNHTSPIPLKEVLRDLRAQFSKAMEGYPEAVRGNDTYKHQCEFAWYVHEITAGPACLVYSHVNECKDFIKTIAPKSA